MIMKTVLKWTFLLILSVGLCACNGDSPKKDYGYDAEADSGDPGTDRAADGGDVNGDGDVIGDGDGQPADQGPVELVISGVLPSRGPVEGGTWANIVGAGFVNGIDDSPFGVRDVTDVTFADNSAVDIEIIRDDMISVRTPPGIAGSVPVTVENPNGSFTLPDAFTYFEAVSAYQATPEDLSARGGTPIEVLGTGFTADTLVLVGGRPAASILVHTADRVGAVSPPGEPGPADVEVVNKNGQALLFRAVSYHPVPRLDALDPAAGPEAGGTPLVAAGQGFADPLDLLFGTAPATDLAVAATQIQATAPAGSGRVDVTVAGPVDQDILEGGFVYLPAVTGTLGVSGVAPARGPVDGGVPASVAGEGFSAGVTAVLFGANPANNVQVIDDRILTLEVPAGQPGPVAVTVQTAADQAVQNDAYTYFTPIDATGMVPQSGPVGGSTAFSIQGSGFHSQVQVLFGGAPAQSLDAPSAAEITGLTPPGTSGPVDVTLRDSDSQDVLAGAFTYRTDLDLLHVEPDAGAVAGGTYVIVYGRGFGPDARIWFGDAEGSVLQVESENVLTARTPRSDTGEVTVAIESGGQRAELAGGFSYFDPKNNRGGASGGPIQGSFNVTALDGSYINWGAPVPGAFVVIQEPAISGVTNDRGQVTFSGPSLVRAVTVTVGKEGYQAITLVNLNAANLTVYMYPNEREPTPPNGWPVTTCTLSGRVFGFKDIPGLPQGPGIQHQAFLNLTSYSIYSVPPYGSIPYYYAQPIEEDGDRYEYTLRLGTYSVYALFGAYDTQTEEFTPALLGLRRAIRLPSEEPVSGQDVVLSSYLDQSAPVHLQDPPLDADALYGAYVSLDLGRDGVIYLSQDTGQSVDMVLQGLPSAASSSFIFVGTASKGGGYPISYTFRRQEGDVGAGVTLGPFLDFTEIVEPQYGAELTDGRFSWTVGDPRPELIQILVETNELMPNILWRVVLPGDVDEVTLPEDLVGLLPQGEPLILLMYTADSPRFSFDRFNYSQLSTSRWTSYTVNLSMFTAP
jgi:hypothetical protein